MDQISLPFRIALLGILVVGALYLTVLKPKDSASAPPVAAKPAATAPGVKGLTTAVDKAKGAVATQAQSDAATQAATGDATATPTATSTPPAASPTSGPVADATPAKRASKPASNTDPSAPILAELDGGHTAVILFVGPRAADDRAVRRAVGRVSRHGGTVDVHTAPISRVGAYEAITRGVTILQAPTILVIDRKLSARKIVGFTTTSEIDQLVDDMRRTK